MQNKSYNYDGQIIYVISTINKNKLIQNRLLQKISNVKLKYVRQTYYSPLYLKSFQKRGNIVNANVRNNQNLNKETVLCK